MWMTGDYIVPYFNGAFRFQKPVLNYWLIALAYELLGESEFAARFFAGLAVAGTCVIVYRLGDGMFGRPAGILAAALLAVAPTIVVLGKLCIPDGPQLLFATGCFAALHVANANRTVGVSATSRQDRADRLQNVGVHSTASPPASLFPAFGQVRSGTTSFAPFHWFWVLLALATLTKGPIVAGMIVATLVAYRLLTGRWILPVSTDRLRVDLIRSRPHWSRIINRWISPTVWTGPLLFVAIVGPWLAAVTIAVGLEFFTESVGNQLIRRAVSSFDGRWLPPGYYLASLVPGFAPGIAVAVLAIVRFRGEWRTDGPVPYLLAWVLGPMLLLELFRSRQIHYFAPAYPALALLAAGYLARLLRCEFVWLCDGHTRRCALLLFGSGLVVAGAFVGLAVTGPETSARLANVCGAIVFVATVVAVRWFLSGRVLPMVAIQIGSMSGILAIVGGILLPRFEPVRVIRPIALRLEQLHRQTDTPIVLHRVFEPSLIHYSRLTIPECPREDDFAARLAAADREIHTVMTAAEFDRWAGIDPQRFLIAQTWRGWVKMHPEVIHLVRVRPRNGVESASIRGATR
jgi:4-amino-4-deoxy-L-arabinose transferase-like glycosyltransferase